MSILDLIFILIPIAMAGVAITVLVGWTLITIWLCISRNGYQDRRK